MSERTNCDIAIIGAGILGCTIAVSAIKAGLDVVVIDRNRTPGFGSTSSSAGIVRVHAMDRESAMLAHMSVPFWENWREFTETPAADAVASFVRCGTIILDDGHSLNDRLKVSMAAADIPFDWLDTDALSEAYPYLDVHRFGPPAATLDGAEFWEEPIGLLPGALHTPDSGYVGDPALAAQNLAAQAIRGGASFLLGSPVVTFSDAQDEETLLTLQNGDTVHAKTIVNAAGPHSQVINKLAGVGGDFSVGLRTLRQELHNIEVPKSINLRDDGVHIVDGDLGINFRPDGDNAVLVGSNGSARDGELMIDDPDEFRETPTRAMWSAHATRLASRIPGVKVTSHPNGLAGLYDATDDWLPIYDRTDRPGFFVAIGSSGNQFKTAPVVGDLMVQMIKAALEGQNTDEDPITFTPEGSSRSIPLAAFSRRRTPNLGGVRG